MTDLNYRNFSAVAFDFDGTLSHTIAVHEHARAQAFEAMAAQMDDERFRDIPAETHAAAHQHGSNPSAIIGWILQESGIVPVGTDVATDPTVQGTVAAKKQFYNKLMCNGAEAADGAVPLIKRLAVRRPARLAIVTTAHRDTELMPFLNRYALARYFHDDRLVTEEDVPHDQLKPDPLAYQIALERLELTHAPERMLVVEDSPRGIVAGRRAGAIVVAVAATFTPQALHDLEGDQHPHAVANDLNHLSDLLHL